MYFKLKFDIILFIIDSLYFLMQRKDVDFLALVNWQNLSFYDLYIIFFLFSKVK